MLRIGPPHHTGSDKTLKSIHININLQVKNNQMSNLSKNNNRSFVFVYFHIYPSTQQSRRQFPPGVVASSSNIQMNNFMKPDNICTPCLPDPSKGHNTNVDQNNSNNKGSKNCNKRTKKRKRKKEKKKKGG